jgi:hypothetical protein
VVEAGELGVAITVVRAIEALGLRYLIGGSLASSLHGVPRSSNDADLLVELPAARVAEFVGLLEAEFYADAGMIRDAIRHRISFNLIHYESAFKVDVFVLTNDAMLQEEMLRRQPHDTGDGGPIYFATPEDIVLQKLSWYRKGGEISERQWTDVIGILKVQRGRFDDTYARHWATRIGIADLLERALSESA